MKNLIFLLAALLIGCSTVDKVEVKTNQIEKMSESVSGKIPVKFSYQPLIGGKHEVFLSGDFNNWSKSESLMKEIDTRCWQTILEITTYQLIAKKRLSIDYDVQELHSVIKDNKPFEPEHFYNIYLILEDNNYLKTAYDRVKLIASELRLENREKYLTFYYPKAIVEEWEKVK